LLCKDGAPSCCCRARAKNPSEISGESLHAGRGPRRRRVESTERLHRGICHPGTRASCYSWLLTRPAAAVSNGKRRTRDSAVVESHLAMQGWGTLVLLSGESGFTAGFAIRADALRAIRGCSRAPASVVLDGSKRARAVSPRSPEKEAKSELPVSPWNRANRQEDESGFTAKPWKRSEARDHVWIGNEALLDLVRSTHR
jgi:hypothetical protein